MKRFATTHLDELVTARRSDERIAYLKEEAALLLKTADRCLLAAKNAQTAEKKIEWLLKAAYLLQRRRA